MGSTDFVVVTRTMSLVQRHKITFRYWNYSVTYNTISMNPGGGEIIRPAWGPPNLLYDGYRQGRGVDHPPHLAPRLKKE
jgi:hypothetical protein